MYYNVHTHMPSEEPDVCSLINVGVDCRKEDQLKALSSSCYYSLGIHPWTISEEHLYEELSLVSKMSELPFVKAIGECGLDKLCDTPFELQRRAFAAQIDCSEKIQKPLIIHCVKAFDEVIAYKKQFKPRQQWIIHGFRGNWQQAEQLIRQGFYISFGLLYNEDAIRQIPMDKLFLETDDKGHSIHEIYMKAALTLDLHEQDLVRQIESNFSGIFYFP